MKRREHRSETIQFGRDFHRVNGASVEINAIRRNGFDVIERSNVWEFVREANTAGRGISSERLRKV
jgi:hypothetical protein